MPGTAADALQRYSYTQIQMGVSFALVLYASDEASANAAAQAALERVAHLNQILSDYNEDSELSRLSKTAGSGQAVKVSDDLWKVLTLAAEFSRQSEGAFDITVGPVVRLWRRARRNKELPAADRLEEARRAVGYRLIRLDPQAQTVELLQANMRLDLGGIAVGYAAQEALAVLRNLGIRRALVDGSGDIVLGDPPPDREGWRIALEPLDGRPQRFLILSQCAISTSGDAFQFVEIGGRRYSHIVDPRTGLGLTDQSNVTVIAPDGASADALATAVSVLGPEKGLKLIEETPGTAAFIIRNREGKVETHASRRWKE
jgi:thiamine biosynthesis lipoprotein